MEEYALRSSFCLIGRATGFLIAIKDELSGRSLLTRQPGGPVSLLSSNLVYTALTLSYSVPYLLNELSMDRFSWPNDHCMASPPLLAGL